MTIIRDPVDRLLSAYYYWGKEYFTRPGSKISFNDPKAPILFAKYKCSPQECWRWGYYKYLRGNAVSYLDYGINKYIYLYFIFPCPIKLYIYFLD